MKWKQILDSNYSVSTDGCIRNDKTERILKPFLHTTGYCKVDLRINKRRRKLNVGRIVAMSFIPNPDDKSYINHKNLIKTDNRVKNLEWVTARENSHHAIKNGHGGYRWPKNLKAPIPKICPTQVKEIRERHKAGLSAQSLSVLYGLHYTHINKIINYQRWKNI